MKRIRILPIVAAAVLAACNALTGSDPAGVEFDADRREYRPDDTIVATLLNTSDTDVGYNLCGAPLERLSGGSWTRVARNPETPCIQPLYVLRPGESASHREPAARVPGPGVYRLRTDVEAMRSGVRFDVVTEPFTVRE